MDNNAEALKIAKNLTPIIEQTVRRMTENCVRSKLYTVSTAPNGSVIGVKDAFDSNEMLIPYSTALTNASVGDAVWCVWMGSNQSTMVAMWAGDLVSYKGEVKPEPYTLLWENPSPTSGFAAQTVSVDLRNWDWISITYKFNSSTTNLVSSVVAVGRDIVLSAPNLGSTMYDARRTATTSTTGVAFGQGYRNTTGTAGAGYAVPFAIYGVHYKG